MISIVVCSKDIVLYNKFATNVSSTIGVPFELIRIDNSILKTGICTAYNQGAQASNYEILCFVHEDVRFITMNWGKNVIKHLAEESTGAIGIAGGAYKSCVPSSWSLVKKYTAKHLIQYFKHKKKKSKIVHCSTLTTEPYRVNCLDGVFIATKKNIWKIYPFDEKFLVGFHGYDADFSFGISLFKSLYVVFDITLEHYSEGAKNQQWLESMMYITNKWENYLPACTCVQTITGKEDWQLYVIALKQFYKSLKKFGYSKFQIIWKMRKHGVWKAQSERSVKLIRKMLYYPWLLF